MVYVCERERECVCVRKDGTDPGRIILCVVDPMETNGTTSMLSQFVGVEGGGNRAEFIPGVAVTDTYRIEPKRNNNCDYNYDKINPYIVPP